MEDQSNQLQETIVSAESAKMDALESLVRRFKDSGRTLEQLVEQGMSFGVPYELIDEVKIAWEIF